MKYPTLTLVSVLLTLAEFSADAQQFTTKARQLIITNEGYDSAFYRRDFNQHLSTITLERAVLFVGHHYYLHDGRLRTIEEAILRHDGEAKKSHDAFSQLTNRQREQLIKFLNSL